MPIIYKMDPRQTPIGHHGLRLSRGEAIRSRMLVISLQNLFGIIFDHRSEGFALTGYVVPGCVEDGAWMLWGNSSVVVAVVLALSFLDIFSKKSSFLVIFHEKLTFGTFIFKNNVSQKQIFAEGRPSPSFSAFIFEKICIFYENSSFLDKNCISCQKLSFLVENSFFVVVILM